jgi:thioredoxin-like negative regulator of GroEL
VVRSRIQATDPRTFQIVSGQNQLVMFYANWSNESNSMAPVINSLADRYKDRILFTFLDIEDPANSLFKILLGDRLPRFFLLDAQGNVLKEWQGIVPAIDFEQVFNTTGG